jgi:hypothetical protein
MKAPPIEWFVHPETDPPCPLGFLRDSRDGALIIGGQTGTHMTGHGERATAKMNEILSLGYIPLADAIKSNLIPAAWTPPSLNASDASLVRHVEAKNQVKKQ